MNRFTISIAAAAFAVTSLGCAHEANKPRKVTPPSMSAIRLDEAIRNSCSTATAMTPVFEFNSTQLTTEAQSSLDTIAACLSNGKLKEKTIRLIGYTDPVGTKEFNHELGYERADTVASYLESRGVKRTQLVVMSRGEEGASPDPERWPADRIVDLSVVN